MACTELFGVIAVVFEIIDKHLFLLFKKHLYNVFSIN